jgi:hypothetical protein
MANMVAIIDNINFKGQAILDGGEPWAEGVLVFGAEPDMTNEEERAISERLLHWEKVIVSKNGRKIG